MTRQLIAWLTGLVTAFWLIAATLGVFVIEDELTEAMDRSMKEAAERLVPILQLKLDILDGPEALQIAQAEDVARGEFLLYQVRNAKGEVVLRSDDAPEHPFEAPLANGFWKSPEFQYYTASAQGGIYVQVADLLEARDNALRESSNSLFLPLLGLIPMLIGTIAIVVRRSLRPVRSLSAEIERRNTGNMDAVSVPSLPPELRQMAVSVNNLLARLRAALEAEREFTSNSAHELRTPVAGALAQAQLLAAQLAEGPNKRRAFQIQRSLSELGQIAEKLLQLSRADAGLGLDQKEADLVPIVELVINDLRGIDPSGRLRYDKAQGAVLWGPYNVDAFAIAIKNLIENALLHGDPSQPVEVRIEADGVVRIINGSEMIAPEDLGIIRQRFVRGNSTAPGSGLGLSIVERLLNQMSAEMILNSPATGRKDGFEAVIRFKVPSSS